MKIYIMDSDTFESQRHFSCLEAFRCMTLCCACAWPQSSHLVLVLGSSCFLCSTTCIGMIAGG